jgi:hypothetical protein
MHKKIIQFPVKAWTPVGAAGEVIKIYNQAVELHRAKEYAKADAIFQRYGLCLTHLASSLELAWNLGLIKNKVDGFYEKDLINSKTLNLYGEIDGFLHEWEDFLLKYSGAKYDHTYGLWSFRQGDDPEHPNNTLRHFFCNLPSLRPVPPAGASFYEMPAVKDFYTSIVEHDLCRHDQNRFALRKLYYEKGNEYLIRFLSKYYPVLSP